MLMSIFLFIRALKAQGDRPRYPSMTSVQLRLGYVLGPLEVDLEAHRTRPGGSIGDT